MYLYIKFTWHSNMVKRGTFAAYRKTEGREIGINKLNREKEDTLNPLCANFDQSRLRDSASYENEYMTC